MKQLLPNRPYRLLFPILLLLAIPGFLMANNKPFTPVELSIAATNGGILSCLNQSVTLTASSTESNTIFSWAGPHGFTAAGAVIVVTQQGTYRVVASSSEGISTASFSVMQAGAIAEPFWQADFTLPDGTTAVTTGNNQWSSAHTGVNTTKFSVLNNEFIVNNSKQSKEGTWSSAVINIAGKNKVNITADLRSHVAGNGSLENDTTNQGDYIRLYYVLDGGAEVLFCDKSGNINNNDPVYTTINSELLTGATLQIIIRSRASANDEFYYFDNVTVASLNTDALTVTASATETLTCARSLVQLTGSSNKSNVSYNWWGPVGFTATVQNPVVQLPGTYTLLVTDIASGCTATASTTVLANTTPPGEISINNSGILTCLNSSVTIAGSSSSSGVTYSWTGPNGFKATTPSTTVRQGGIYTLTATNPANGCTVAKSTTVATNTTAPVVAIGNNGPISCARPEVTLSASTATPNATFLWLSEDFIAEAAVITTGTPGFYILTVTDPANGCITTEFADVTADYTDCGARNAITSNMATTQNITNSFTHKAYPNPVINNSVIEFTSPGNTQAAVSIFNSLGVCESILFNGAINAHQTYRVAIDKSTLTTGAHYYIININGHRHTGKLMIVQ